MKLSRLIMLLRNYTQPRTFWLMTFLASLMSVAQLWQYFDTHNYPRSAGIGLFCFAVFKTEIIVIFGLLTRRRFVRALYLSLWTLFVLLSFVNWFSVTLYGFGVSRRLVLVMMQTSISEIEGFLPGMLYNIRQLICSLNTIGLVIFVFSIYAVIRRIGNEIFNIINSVISVGGVIYLCWFCWTFSYNKQNHMIVPTAVLSVNSVLADEREYRQNVSQIRSLPAAETLKTDTLAYNLLLIIGESASSEHHGLYGYPLETTPCLSSMRDSLAVFTDAIGACASTSESVPKILSYQPDKPSGEPWSSYPSIFQLFGGVGYHTYWLSNQDRTGVAGGTYSVIASRADVQKYIGTENVRDHLNSKYDEELLPEIESALADSFPTKMIAVHLFGSHTNYKDRYPQSKSRFSAHDILRFNHKPWINEKVATRIAEYDNSIAYTDSVLSEIIRLTAESSSPSVMIYVADHGENVFDDGDFVGRDARFVRVPMIIYMNEAYRRKNPQIVANVFAAVSRPISTASIIYAMQTLSGTSYSFYEAAEDFISPSFLPRVRYSNDEPWPQDVGKYRSR